nr:unnamed protein product [Digitaria exilis]
MSTVSGTRRAPRRHSQDVSADKVVVNLETSSQVAESRRGASTAVAGAQNAPIDVEAIEDEVQVVSPSRVPPPEHMGWLLLGLIELFIYCGSFSCLFSLSNNTSLASSDIEPPCILQRRNRRIRREYVTVLDLEEVGPSWQVWVFHVDDESVSFPQVLNARGLYLQPIACLHIGEKGPACRCLIFI